MTRTEIKIALLRAGIQSADIARRLGVSKTAVHNVIKGLGTSQRIKAEIASVIGKSISEIWPNDEPCNIETPAFFTRAEDLVI